MRRTAVVWFVFLLLPLCALAQAPAGSSMAQPMYFYVHEEVARPSMLAQYEATTKEFGAMLRDNATPPFLFRTLSGDDYHYYYVIPMNGMADLDRMQQSFASLAQKIPEKFSDLWKRGGAAMDHYNEWVFRYRPDFSYMPDNARVTQNTAKAARYDFYYLQPGTEGDTEGIAKAWKTALAAKKIPNGFNVYEAVMGADLPLVVVEIFGNSDADISAASASDMEKLGADAMTLNTRTIANVRHFESRFVEIRPDLSTWSPPKAMTTK